jgi:hypothetical protein
MLYAFVDLNRDLIISRTRDRVRSRPWPSVAPGEVEHGVPLFLTQLSETLRMFPRTRGQSEPPATGDELQALSDSNRIAVQGAQCS